MAGTAGRPSFASVVAAGEPVVGGVEVVAAGAMEAGGGVIEGAVDGHAGAPLSADSDEPFVPVNDGAPSGDWVDPFAPACTGPSLIFMYKYTPTPSRIVIVTSGRIEPIDRPP